MWKKALNVIPDVSKDKWDHLDVISKWLISTCAAVLVMTFISAALEGLFAWRNYSNSRYTNHSPLCLSTLLMARS